MNIDIDPGNRIQLNSNCSSSIISFRVDGCNQEPVITPPSARSDVSAPRRRHLGMVGRQIDQAFGKVDVLWQLDKRTLERMAINPTTPVVVLERLANHPTAEVRAAVAENEYTPLYAIWALAKDGDADVRYQLAENHNLPQSLIRSLTNDENPYVACRAQKTYDRQQAS